MATTANPDDGLKDITPGATNPRGIPTAPFIDRVEDYVANRSQVESVLKNFQEMISKYQFMETSTTRRLTGLDDKIPDISKTLQMVQFLQSHHSPTSSSLPSSPLHTTFELNDTLYAHALIPPTSDVYLWLGANVMLSYPLDEAEELLSAKLEGAKEKKRECEEDIEFLREQITTLEVATARVYNWDVGVRRKEREGGAGGEAVKGEEEGEED